MIRLDRRGVLPAALLVAAATAGVVIGAAAGLANFAAILWKEHHR